MAKQKLFSRNTKLENAYHTAMRVEVIRDPGNFEMKKYVIEPGQHIYMCYDDFRIEYNRSRPVYVFVYLDGRQFPLETQKIRDNKKVELNYLDGDLTSTCTQGRFISRLGYFLDYKLWSISFRCSLYFICCVNIHFFSYSIVYLLFYGFNFHRLIIKLKQVAEQIKSLGT